jgi:UDP-N-acetyl-D-glucosamine dehydrogenase
MKADVTVAGSRRFQASNAIRDELIRRIEARTAVVGIFGLGYVGLPLVLRYAACGFKVIGFDIDSEKVASLTHGRSYIRHIRDADIDAARAVGFEPTSDFSRASEADALILCVPTPLDAHREPDLSFVLATTEEIVPHMRAGQVMSLESTTYPGTTEEELLPRIERQPGLQVGDNVFLVFSPEREDPGNASFSTRTIPKICGGITPHCLQVGMALYSQAIDRVVAVSSTRAAEMTKLLENIHRSVNIGLVNEMKMIADRMDVDIHEVIRAASTKPFGFVPYYPGPGLGGHCIPIDPFYLTWKAREYGVHTRFIELAGEINSAMPAWVVGKLRDALDARMRSIKGSRILVLGIAYKRDVDDPRESPAIVIMEQLREMGALVDYSDPHVPVFPKMRKHRFDLRSVALDEATIETYDAVLITTDHSSVDYELVRRAARLIVDTRDIYRERASNIVKA